MALGFALLTETPKPRRVWLRIVGDNERRINDESLRYRYVHYEISEGRVKKFTGY